MALISFTGRVALVTGAGSGIGRATALLLASRGARVVVNDPGVDAAGKSRAESVVREIRAAGGEAIAEISAVGTHVAGRRIVAATLKAYGRIDILVNNAGIARPGPFGEGADTDINFVLRVNLLGPYALMRAAWPHMRERRYGRIVNLASSAALGSGISGAYAASKGGLLSLSKDAGIAGKPLGISVNALMPSAYTSLIDHHPDVAYREWMRRHLPAGKVAAVIAFLASEQMRDSAEVFAAGGGRVSRIVFLESIGHFEAQLTPEAVQEHYGKIGDMSGATVLRTQSDHQENYARLFGEA